MKRVSALLFLIPIWQALVAIVFAHNSIIYPCPRFSEAGVDCPDELPKGEKLTDEQNYPIYSKEDGILEPLCKFTTPWPGTKVRWSPGQEVTVKFNSWSVSHSGGHCQFSISYDNGKTFAVIHEELQYCFVGSKPKDYTEEVSVYDYTFTLPDLPASDTAVFVWTWVAAVGNREFFMNCADIIIENSDFESYTGKNITIANYPGYPTIPEFEMDYDTGLEYYRAPYIQNSTVAPATLSLSKSKESASSSVSSASSSKVVNIKAMNGSKSNGGEGSENATSDDEYDEDKCDDEEIVDNNDPEYNAGSIEGDDEWVCDTGETEGDVEGETEGDDDDDYVCDDKDTEDIASSSQAIASSSRGNDPKPTDTGISQQEAGLPVIGDGEPGYMCDVNNDEEDEDAIDVLNSIASAHSVRIDILGDVSSEPDLESPSPTLDELSSSFSSFVLFEYSSVQQTAEGIDAASSNDTDQAISSPMATASGSSGGSLSNKDSFAVNIKSVEPVS